MPSGVPIRERFRPGDRLPAATVNAMLDALDAAGVDLGRLMGATGSGRHPGRLLATVERVHRTDGGAPGTPVRRSQRRYDLRVLGRPGPEGLVAAVDPAWGCPAADDSVRVVPAAVGDRCFIERFPDGEGRLILAAYVQERLTGRAC